MKRLQNQAYQQRSLFLLLPLMLFALLIWTLNPRITTEMTPGLRHLCLNIIRVVFPGIFAVMLVLLIPLKNRFIQFVITLSSYIILIVLVANINSDLLHNPVICSFAASASILAMLPSSVLFDEDQSVNDSHEGNRISAFMLPYLVLIGSIVILRQIQSFVEFSFSPSFGTSFLSFIYAPIFLVMQTFGHHEFLSYLASTNYDPLMRNAFINAIFVSNVISLPTIILVRSFFNGPGLRVFLTFLSAICAMTASIGGCVSLISLLIMIFLPGTFIVFLLNSVILCFLSYFMILPALTEISNLYTPDINMMTSHLIGFRKTHLYLFLFAFIFPVFYVLISIMFKKERTQVIKQRKSLIKAGTGANNKNSPDLSVIAILRSIGGLSNLRDVKRQGSTVFLHINDIAFINMPTLNTLTNKKISYDRIKRVLSCDFGDNAAFFQKRLQLLNANEFFMTEQEVPLTPAFAIKPMPHVKPL